MNLKAILDLFKTTKIKTTCFNEQDKAITRDIVSRLSEGSISLQSNRYATEADINNRAKQVLGHNFCK